MQDETDGPLLASGSQLGIDGSANSKGYNLALQDVLAPIGGAEQANSSSIGKGKQKAVSFIESDQEDGETSFVYDGSSMPNTDIAFGIHGYDKQMQDILGQADQAGRAQQQQLILGQNNIGDLQEMQHLPPQDTRISSAKIRPEVDVFRESPSSHLSTSSVDEPLREIATSPPPRLNGSHSSNSIHTLGHGHQRPAHILPTIQRLRSGTRFPSLSSMDSFQSAPDIRRLAGSPASSKFDALSRQSSSSNIRDLPESITSPPSSVAQAEALASSFSSFRWTPLRKISNRVFSSATATRNQYESGVANSVNILGPPTVIAASGVICVGTSKGWTMVFDYAQSLKCICGNDAISKEAGAVTALAISQDHTFIAVGHATGYIHLYALAQPVKPARSVAPTKLAQIQSGFVGLRHTAIVSSDDRGLAFYHSLGQVLGLANTDILLILGRYPTSEDQPALTLPTLTPSSDSSISPTLLAEVSTAASKTKQAPVIFDMSPLPLGTSAHPTDIFSLVALITPTKLVIAGLKPKPRTWWRCLYKETSQPEPTNTTIVGSAAWYPCTSSRDGDPMLAFSWGRQVRLISVSVVSEEGNGRNVGKQPSFIQKSQWTTEGAIVRIQWLSPKILAIQTVSHIDLWDTATLLRAGRAPLDLRTITNPDTLLASNSTSPQRDEDSGGSILSAYNVRSYRGKVFVLALSDVRVATSLSWADRILTLVNSSNLLEAIDLTTLYYQGLANASALGLPADDAARHSLVHPKLNEIVQASIEYVFSDKRMQDGTHDDPSGRGVDRTSLFEGLVDASLRASLATGSFDRVYSELYERYEDQRIVSIYLRRLSTFLLTTPLAPSPQPVVVQRLIDYHANQLDLESTEQIIWRVDPELLDINQIVKLCTAHRRWDPLFYVFTQSLRDWISPLVILLGFVLEVETSRANRSKVIEVDRQQDTSILSEESVPDAYRIFPYLANAFRGIAQSKGTDMPQSLADEAKRQGYSFVFSRKAVTIPQTGKPLLIPGSKDSTVNQYPYLRLLLRFDAEAMLDCLDSAFEDSFLNDLESKRMSRQKIINILLDLSVQHSEEFSSQDQTFIHIFIARNLPKYPQLLSLTGDTIHRILVNLIDDTDLSTRADRELAAEFLFSVYAPSPMQELTEKLNEAGFYRILRSMFKSSKQWAALAKICLKDPEIGQDVFQHLDQVLRSSRGKNGSPNREASDVVFTSVVQLVEIDLFQTVELVERFLPQSHQRAVETLEGIKGRQFAYLRCLLEPEAYRNTDTTPISPLRARDAPELQRLYIRLLCLFDRPSVIQYLDKDHRPISDAIVADCEREHAYSAVIWAMDRNGQLEEAFDKLSSITDSQTDLVIAAFHQMDTSDHFEFESGIHQHLDQIKAVFQVGTEICVKHSQCLDTDVDVEELWFKLFASCIGVSQNLAGRLEVLAPNDLIDPLQADDASVIDRTEDWQSAIRLATESLLRESLSALVSSTDSRIVSFPRLVRQLIAHSSERKRASFGQFRPIIQGMINTYKAEGEALLVAKELIDQDLFDQVVHLTGEKSKGWRPTQMTCAACKSVLWGDRLLSSLQNGGKPSIAELYERLAPPVQRPSIKRKPSLKGKETDWPEQAHEMKLSANLGGGLQPIVVLRKGVVMHRSCYESGIEASLLDESNA